MATLKDVIGELIGAEQKGSARLARGLVLAYTPTVKGDLVDHRLVWSRKGSLPSTVEDEIMEAHFTATLRDVRMGRPKVVRRDLQVMLTAGWGSSLLILRTEKVKQQGFIR